MNKKISFSHRVSVLMTFGKPPLAILAFCFGVAVIVRESALMYWLGVLVLFSVMVFDLIDGWFSGSNNGSSKLAALADRLLDRLVLSIICPLLVAGMFWRYFSVHSKTSALQQFDLLHAVFVLVLVVTILGRDQIAGFFRSFAEVDNAVEPHQLAQLRKFLTLPVATLIYILAFYIPKQSTLPGYAWLTTINDIPPNVWLIGESAFMFVLAASIGRHAFKYGMISVESICAGDDVLKRRILSVIPNSISLFNAFFGVLAVVLASYGRYKEALFVIIGAALFDLLDGLAARKLKLTKDTGNDSSTLVGVLADDLSDTVSFCIAPALVYYYMMLNYPEQWLVVPVAIVYCVAGMGRLLYFTLDKKPIKGFFKGVPVPASAIFVMALMVSVEELIELDWLSHDALSMWIITVAMLSMALMMNLYKLLCVHFGRYSEGKRIMMLILLLVWLFGSITPFYGITVLIIMIIYLAASLNISMKNKHGLRRF